MRSSDANNYWLLAKKYLYNRYSFLSSNTLVLDTTGLYSFGSGSTIDDDQGRIMRVFVGCVNNDVDGSISDYDFMKPLVGMFHEVSGHCCQIEYQFHGGDKLSQVLAANHYACKTCDEYYMGNRERKGYLNYWFQPKEIAAQYAGIDNAYVFCKYIFGEERANNLICNYVNNRISEGTEFIGFKGKNERYMNVNDILDAFDDVFQKSIHRHRVFDHVKAVIELYSEYGSYVRKHMDMFTTMFGMVNVSPVGRERDGAYQDVLMASVYLQERESHGLWRLKALSSQRDVLDRAFEKTVRKGFSLDDTAGLGLGNLIDPTRLSREKVLNDLFGDLMNKADDQCGSSDDFSVKS